MMKIFREFFVLLVSFSFFVGGDFKCKKSQYFEIGSNGTLDCSFPRAFQAVYWYDSLDTNANIIVRMEIQDSGSFYRTGAGFLNGSYDISDEGHLIIRNITPVHDRTLKAVLVDDSDMISNYIVTVVTTYNLEGNYPAIDACHNKHKGTNNCVVRVIGSLVKCTYSNSRPAMSLVWQVEYPTQKKHSVKGSDNVYLDSTFTYTATSALEISEIAHNPLLVLTCSAFGPAITTDVNSSVVVDGTASSYVDWQNFAKYDQYMYINSREELHCNNSLKKSSAYMWKYETRETAQVLMYFMNGQEWQSDTLSGVSFTEEGSLVFEKMTVAQEGTYTCVTVGDELSTLTAINVNVIVPPSPPGIDVAGCPTVNNDCELFLSNNTSTLVSCNVTGVKPKVSLSIQSLNSSGVIILTRESIESNQGDLFNAAIVAEVELQENATCPFILVCVASGAGSQSFSPRRIISLVPDTCQYFVLSRSVYIISFSTAGVMILLIVTVCFIVKRKMVMSRAKDSREATKNLTTYVQELADIITYWPLRQLLNSAIFEEEVISLLRNVSDEVEENRKKENKRVIGGAAAGIVGGVMAIAAPIFPALAVPLLVGGVVMGAAGAGVNIAASWDKLRKDEAKSNSVQKPLGNFLAIQKEIAEAIVLLYFEYKAIRDVHIDSFLKESHRGQIVDIMNKAKMKQNSKHSTLQHQLSHVHSFACELCAFITEVLSHESSMLVVSTEWKTKMETAMALPFQHLHESIKYLLYNEQSNTQVTFLMFVKLLYHPGQGLCNGDNKVDVRCTRQARGYTQADLIQGGLLVGRAAVNVVDVGEDFVEIGNSVFRITRGVSVAGILLSTLGIMLDVAFLGSAIFDLQKSDKGQLATALSEVADTMEIMNYIVKELTQDQRSQVG